MEIKIKISPPRYNDGKFLEWHYGLKNFQRQALHATHLGFFHPILKKNMEFKRLSDYARTYF